MRRREEGARREGSRGKRAQTAEADGRTRCCVAEKQIRDAERRRAQEAARLEAQRQATVEAVARKSKAPNKSRVPPTAGARTGVRTGARTGARTGTGDGGGDKGGDKGLVELALAALRALVDCALRTLCAKPACLDIEHVGIELAVQYMRAAVAESGGLWFVTECVCECASAQHCACARVCACARARGETNYT